jgi:hypothetical protein
MLVGCQENITDPIPTPTEIATIEKTAPPTGAFPYMQEFLYIKQVEYSVDGTNILVEIKNRNIFNRGTHFFAEINYANGSLMIYLNKPSTMYFTIPYFGTPDVVSIKLYCIMEY